MIISQLGTSDSELGLSLSLGYGISVSQTSLLGTPDTLLGNSFLLGLLETPVSSATKTGQLGILSSQFALTLIYGYNGTFFSTYVGSGSNALIFTGTVTEYVQHNRSVTSAIVFTETATPIRIVSKSVSNTLGFSDVIYSQFDTHPDNTLILSQTLTYNLIYHESVSNHLTFTESIISNIKGASASNTLSFSELAKSNFNLLTVTNTLSFSETATSNLLVRSVSSTLSFTEVATAIGYKNVANTLTFTESGTQTRILYRSANNTLSFIEAAGTVYHYSFDNTLTFTDAVHRILLFSASNTLTFTGSSPSYRFSNQNISGHINLVQLAKVKNILNFHLTDTLTFKTHYDRPIPIPGVTLVVPILDFIIKRPHEPCLVILQTDDSVILLPCPEFDDKISNSDSIVIRKSMNGHTYSYIKTCDLQKLSYTFRMDRLKSLELRQFVNHNTDKLITLRNWKGEKWLVKQTNNPTKLDPKMRWDFCGERVDVTLDFEGIRLI